MVFSSFDEFFLGNPFIYKGIGSVKLIVKHVLFILLLGFLSACSGGSGDSSPEETPKTNIFRVDDISGQILQVEAGQSSSMVSVGPIYGANGQQVQPSNIFEVRSSSSSVKLKKNGQEVSVVEVAPDQDGKLSFEAITSTATGLYSVTIKGKGFESAVGVVYFQVNPSGIENLGSISTSYFRDEAPFNDAKDSGEKFGVLDRQDTQVSVGPIVDQFGNLVKDGSVGVELYGAIFSEFTNQNNDATSEYDVPIRDGFLNFSVVSVTEDPTFLMIASHARQEAGEEFKREVQSELAVLSNQLEITGETDLGVVFLTESKSTSLTLSNTGNTNISSLGFDMGAPFEVQGGTCFSILKLSPGESCTLTIRLQAQTRSVINSLLRVSGTSSGAAMEDVLSQLSAQASLPPDIQISLTNNLMEFADQTVGETATKFFTITNVGDVAGENLVFQNPGPHPGQAVGFFSFRSPAPSEPNESESLGYHCGTTIPPGRKCKIYVDYTPTAVVGPDILGGRLSIDGLVDPKNIFVKGRSFLNNFANSISITSDKSGISKNEIDTMNVTVGPILDKSGIVMEDIVVNVQIFRETPDGAGGSTLVNMGDLTPDNEIIGGPEGVTLIQTDEGGFANFSLKSKVEDTVGPFTIRARIIDNENRVLTEGLADFEFFGAKLRFSSNPINFDRIVINKDEVKDITIFNEGSVDAQGVRVFSRDGFYSVSSEGSCPGISAGTAELGVGEACSFQLSFLPTERRKYLDVLQIETQSVNTVIPSSIFGQGINPGTIVSELPSISGTYSLAGDPFTRKIVINNLGDEDVKNVQAFVSLENSSFTFDIPCTTLGAGKSCTIDMSYNPASAIPYSTLSAEVVLQGVGVEAEFGTEFRIPLEILHSSLVFVDPDPGINLLDCYELQVRAFDIGESDPIDHSQPLPLTLTTNGTGNFYTDKGCSSVISSITIGADEFYSPLFYYRPTVPGVQVLQAQSPVIASAIHSFVVYKHPHHLVVQEGNNQDIFTEEQSLNKMIVRVVDEDGNGVPNVPVNLDILDNIRNHVNRVENGEFNDDLSNWSIRAGNARWQQDFDGSMKLDGNQNDLGSEILSNGGFDSGMTSWTDALGTRGPSFEIISSSFQLRPGTADAPARIEQDIVLEGGKVYQVEGNYEHISGSGLSVMVIDNDNAQGIVNEIYSSTKLFKFTFTAPSSSVKIRLQNGPSASEGSLSYVSVREVRNGVLNNVPEVQSSVLSNIEIGKDYYISTHVKDITGNPTLSAVEVMVVDEGSDEVLYSETISRPVLHTFVYRATSTNLAIRIKQVGYGVGVTAAVDNVYVVERLPNANLAGQVGGELLPPGNSDMSTTQGNLAWFLPAIDYNLSASLLVGGGKLSVDDGGSNFNPTAAINFDTTPGDKYVVHVKITDFDAIKGVIEIRDQLQSENMLGDRQLLSFDGDPDLGGEIYFDVFFEAGDTRSQIALTPKGGNRFFNIDEVIVRNMEEADGFGRMEVAQSNSSFEGPGNVSFDYFAAKTPLALHIRASSNFVLGTPSEVILSHNVEYPTRITGFLGDFVLTSSGPTLTKDGEDQMSRLFSLPGYSWNNSSKELVLPTNQIYDFNSVSIEAGTKLKFDAAGVSRSHGWTQLLSKTFCEIQGQIAMYGAYGDGNAATIETNSVDNEPISYEVPQYVNKGGNGGAGGTYSCNKVSVVGRQGGALGTIWKGGKGGNGAYCSNIGVPTGGAGGRRGYDAPGLFLKCFKSLNGLGGVINAQGEKGVAGSRGANAGSWYTSHSTFSAGGGGGGGGGGHGGNGGKVIMSYEKLLNQPTILVNKGAGSAGGGGGSRACTTNMWYHNPGCKGCGAHWIYSGGYCGSNGDSGASAPAGEVNGDCTQTDLTRGKIKKRPQQCF